MSDWKLVVLKFKKDYPARDMIEVFQNIWSDGIIVKQKKKRYLTRKGPVTASIKRSFKDLEGKILTLYSKGDYHHYTYGLCKVVADKRSEDYCYMHLDRHDDAVFSNHYHIGMASFVQHIKKYAKAKSVLMLGPPHLCWSLLEKDIEPGIELITEEGLRNQKNFRKRIVQQPEKDVYLSCDLDVMARKEFEARWDRGTLKLDETKRVIQTINEEKNIISADILGYGGGDIKSCLVYAVLAGTLIGKDTKEAEKLFEYLKKHPQLREDALKMIEGLKI